MYHYKLHVPKKQDGKGFTVKVSSLPGYTTYGKDVEEAIKMAKETIELYIEELYYRDEVISDDSNTLTYAINLQNI